MLDEKAESIFGYFGSQLFASGGCSGKNAGYTSNTIELAGKFIDFGILKKKSFDDCQHIAAAILAGCDIIISWNFKHIVNVKTVKGVKVITTLEGYKDLLIYPPSVLLEEGDDDE